jgi:hypothetical protein
MAISSLWRDFSLPLLEITLSWISCTCPYQVQQSTFWSPLANFYSEEVGDYYQGKSKTSICSIASMN